MIVTFNIEPEDLQKLDELAGPRGRSKWLREHIANEHEANARLHHLLVRLNKPRRKAPAKKTATRKAA